MEQNYKLKVVPWESDIKPININEETVVDRMRKSAEETVKKTLTEYGIVKNSAKYMNYMQLTYRKSNESALKYFTTNKGKPFKVVEGKLEYDCEVLNTVVNDKIRVLLGVVDIKVRETDDEKG